MSSRPVQLYLNNPHPWPHRVYIDGDYFTKTNEAQPKTFRCNIVQ